MGEADHIVLNRWRSQRDADAFRELVARYSSMVYATCKRVLCNAAEAEDAAQECFEALALAHDAPGTYLGPWLHRLAVRHSLNRRRGESRRKHREEAYAAAQGELTRPEWDDIYLFIDEAIAALPEHLREPIVAHFLEGRTQIAVAETLAVSRQTVAYRIESGIEQVRKSLKKRGVEIEGSAVAGLLAANAAEAAPATLVASLGRICIAGVANAGTETATALATVGGALLVKKTILLAGVLLIATLGMLLYPLVNSEPLDAPAMKSESVPLEARTPPAVTPPVDIAAPTNAPQVSAGEASESTGSISGRVQAAASGRPIPRASVIAYVPPLQGQPKHVRTNESGAFSLEGLGPGKYVVYADVTAFSDRAPRSQLEVELQSGQQLDGVELDVEMGAQIVGTVVDTAGLPVEGVGVFGVLLAADGLPRRPVAGERLHYCTTEEDGQFRMGGFAPGDSVQVCALLEETSGMPTGSAESEPIHLAENDEIVLKLVLDPGITVSGKVVTPEGRPVGGAALSLHSTNPRQEPRRYREPAVSSADGAFELTHIPPGEFSLFINPSKSQGGLQALPPWDIVRAESGKDIRDVVAVLDVKLSISGTVTDLSGRPIPDVYLTAGVGRQMQGGGTDAQGKYEIRGLEDGPCRVRIVFAGSQNFQTKEVPGTILEDIPAGSTGVDFKIDIQPKATLAGRVVAEEEGQPIPTFQLSVVDGGKRYQRGNGVFKDFTDQQGEFTVEKVVPGEVTLVARAKGFADAVQNLGEVPPGAEQRDILIRLRKGISLRGQVQDTHGAPVSGARVFPGPIPVMEIDLPEGMAVARSGSDGTFQADDLPADTAVISALAKGFSPGEAAVIPPEQRREYDAVIVLSKGGTIEGHVYADGQAWPGQRVTLGAPQLEGGSRLVTDAGGTYRFEGVRTGSILLVADARDSAEGHRQITRTVDVREGDVTRVDFDFTTAAHAVEGLVTKDGIPQAHVSVVLAAETSAGMQQSTTSTDAEGLYSFKVEEGLITVTAGSGEEQATRSVEVAGDQEEPVRLDLELSGGLRLTGQVTGLEPGRNAAVCVFEGEVDFGPMTPEEFRDSVMITLRPQLRGNGQVHADGSFEISGLAPGIYTVLVMESHEPESGLPLQGVETVEVSADAMGPMEVGVQ